MKPQGKGSTLFIHLIPGGVSSHLWLSDVFVSQVHHIRACLHISTEILLDGRKLMKFNSIMPSIFYAALQTSFRPASETVACILSQ